MKHLLKIRTCGNLTSGDRTTDQAQQQMSEIIMILSQCAARDFPTTLRHSDFIS